MTAAVHTPPRLDRPDLGVAVFSRWRTNGPDRQAATVDAIAAAWESRPWPTADLLSYSLYTANDGHTLLHYSQWTSEEALRVFQQHHRDERLADIFEAVPDAERLGLRVYDRYRSAVVAPGGAAGDVRVPGCIVTVEIEFEGPDAGRQRAWVDAVFDALDDEPDPHPGGFSAHFHVSTDGAHVLNYAEWESEQAHIDALAAPGDGVGSPTAAWRRVQQYPGLKSSTVTRHAFALSLVPD
ncbi:antibiotic biosynthesis monooxygenase [Streptomyces armeniacus]|uniref:Antibiotic biosynthesis monooxygenase n=1 Tax=Streptomyces armeniacus TaxID=83291 RepID=A0A345XUZ3_9ACTN|nr:antibiotic biosynthesis monooxygenase [Streptomyces armeniacus]AXK35459.1 antibiotic biosynthesis monooxygenase [Streptomyces armeniacus]